MILLTIDEIIHLHKKLVERIDGQGEIRDRGLLESAVFSCIQTFDGEEIYTTTIEKAARLAFAITKNHPFSDGNKRIAILTMLMTLKLNGEQIRYTQEELIALGLGIADSSIDYSCILDWINTHKD